MTTVLKFATVTEAAREFVSGQEAVGKDYVINDYTTCTRIARIAGYESRPDGGYAASREWSSFSGQVGRALDRLALEGEVIRVGVKERGPDGRMPRWTRWYFPVAYRRIEAETAEKRAATAARNGRWDAVRSNLEALGYDPGDSGHPELSLEQWEVLVGQLQGRAV